MAYVAMAYTAMAYIVMAHIVMAVYSYGIGSEATAWSKQMDTPTATPATDELGHGSCAQARVPVHLRTSFGPQQNGAITT